MVSMVWRIQAEEKRTERETIIALSNRYTVDPSSDFQNEVKKLFQSSVLSFE
jgi:hypothetical protein